MKSNDHILKNCFEISEINHFDEKSPQNCCVNGREFYPALYEKRMSLNRKFNFECLDIVVIGNDMKYSRLAHVPDQGVVFRMASLSNFENHFISKTF